MQTEERLKGREFEKCAIPPQREEAVWEKIGANTQSTEQTSHFTFTRVWVEIKFLGLCQLSNSAPEGRRLSSASVL